MELIEIVEHFAISSIEELAKYENETIWLVIVASIYGGDAQAVKVAWNHGGIYDHKGNKFTGNVEKDKIYVCQNKDDTNEFFSVQDLMPKSNNYSGYNSIFAEESNADVLVNAITITRNVHNPKVSKIVDTKLLTRSFTLSGTPDTTLFEILALLDPESLNQISNIK